MSVSDYFGNVSIHTLEPVSLHIHVWIAKCVTTTNREHKRAKADRINECAHVFYSCMVNTFPQKPNYLPHVHDMKRRSVGLLWKCPHIVNVPHHSTLQRSSPSLHTLEVIKNTLCCSVSNAWAQAIENTKEQKLIESMNAHMCSIPTWSVCFHRSRSTCRTGIIRNVVMLDCSACTHTN